MDRASLDRVYATLDRIEAKADVNGSNLVTLRKDVEHLQNTLGLVKIQQELCEARRMYSAVGFLGKVVGVVVALGVSIFALIKNLRG